MPRIPLGSGVTLGDPLTVYDEDGQPTNATGLQFVLRRPGALTDLTYSSPVQVGTGQYQQPVPAADVPILGHYQWIAQATDPAGVLGGKAFDVIDPWAPALLTLGDAREQLQKTRGRPTASDDELQLYVDVAGEQIDLMCGPVVPRVVGPAVVTAAASRSGVTARLPQRPGLDPSAYATVTAVTGPGGVPVTAVVVGGRLTGGAGTPLTAGAAYTVTYEVGRQPIPSSLQLAARILVQHLWRTQREQTSPAPDADGFDVVQTPYGFAIPNRVAELVRRYERDPIALG